SPGDSKPAAKMAGGQNLGTGLPQTNGASNGAKPANGAAAKSPANGAHAAPYKNGASHSTGDASASLLERAGVAPKWDLSAAASEGSSRSDQFASFQVDAPACDNCGAITVRYGNCYLCHNCGNSMGCS